MARTKLNQEKTDLMVSFIEEGNYDMVAAQAAGITRQTFYRWIRRGKDEHEGIYYDFAQAVESAKARGEVNLLKTVKAASTRSWQAAAWMLERSRPARWSLRKPKENAIQHWQNEISQMIKDKEITHEEVVKELGEELAHELFEQAGVTVASIGKTQKESSVKGSSNPNKVSD
jgi:predicted site-specific integrase-resolvase